MNHDTDIKLFIAACVIAFIALIVYATPQGSNQRIENVIIRKK